MPREGVFARVLEGGTIRCGDLITPLPPSSTGPFLESRPQIQ
jgi:MOSC domain-containing protein YiiM